jgi:hypothetical protein
MSSSEQVTDLLVMSQQRIQEHSRSSTEKHVMVSMGNGSRDKKCEEAKQKSVTL